MPSAKVNLAKDARAVLEHVKKDLARRRPAGSRSPSDSDAVLELARRAGVY